MIGFIVRRLSFAAAILLGLSVAVFLVTDLLPGNVGRLILGPFADQRSVDTLNERLGLNDPIHERYGRFVRGLSTGDLGRSVTLDTPIGPLVRERLYNSVVLAGVALSITVPVSFAAGFAAAFRRDKATDRVLGFIGWVGAATPEFVSGVILIYVFGLRWQLLPVAAKAPSEVGILAALGSLLLPVVPIVIVLFAYISRLVRSSAIEVLQSDHYRTAVLNGLSPARRVFGHVVQNSLLPAVTVLGSQFGYVVGGLVVVESLFNYSGVGGLLVYAATSRDVPLLAAITVTMGVVVTAGNLLSDIAYGALNPAIRLDARR